MVYSDVATTSSDAVMKNCDAQSCSDGALMCYDVVLMHSDAAVGHSDAVLVHSDVELMWPDALMSFDVDVLQERVGAESDGWSCYQFLVRHFRLVFENYCVVVSQGEVKLLVLCLSSTLSLLLYC
jgi:hypothetical protein